MTERALSSLSKAGIGVQATLILGIPGETDEAMRSTITWLQSRLGDNRHDIVSPCFFVPFHHEVEKDMAKRVDFTLETDDSDCFTGHIPVTSSDAASIDELWKLYDDMTPTRRDGKYKRIAYLADLSTVQTRLGLLDGGAPQTKEPHGAGSGGPVSAPTAALGTEVLDVPAYDGARAVMSHRPDVVRDGGGRWRGSAPPDV